MRCGASLKPVIKGYSEMHCFIFFYVFFFFFNQIFQLQLEGAEYKSGHLTELSSNQIALPTLRQYLI